MYFILKILITALIVAGVSELARRYSLFAAAIASLPLISILAFVWLYHDTGDVQKVAMLSHDILWLIIPSAIFFVALPLLLQAGLKFYPALLVSCLIMMASYGVFVFVKTKVGA